MTPRLVLLDERDLPTGAACDVALGPVLLRHGLRDADEVVRVHHPEPTAACSRRDTLRPGFPRAAEAARRLGFAPVLRPQGGRLAVYHGGSVVVDHVVRTRDPHARLEERFRHHGEAHAAALRRLGPDVRVGEVRGEYCPGEFSLNVGGTRKVAGAAQRVTRHGWLLSTVVQVTGGDLLREVTRATYAALGYELDPTTVGTLEDDTRVSPEEVAAAVLGVYAETTPLPVVRLPAALRAAVEREAVTRLA